MDLENLKHIVGPAQTGKPAIIRFFSAVNQETTQRFNDEFLWLQDYVKPSKIIVMINSEGGSVLHGMSTFSIIHSCPIEVDCVIEGIAASMGSILWAAGDNRYMHDYSLLMIHNPCCVKKEDMDPTVRQTIEAFRSQLTTIYIKRFGLPKAQVEAIMNGEGEADGTLFSAHEAVKAGFLPLENIIKTSKKVRDKVKNELADIEDTAKIRDLMTGISAEVDENKLLEAICSIRKQEDNTQIQEHNTMEQNETMNFDTISAELGLPKNTQITSITARISELVKAESSLAEIKGELTATKIKLEGKEADLVNANKELDQVKAELQNYKDAEAAAREAEITAVVDDAISAGKIEASAKDAWIAMAKSDLETVKATLGSIQAREKITQVIAQDPENVENIEKTLEDVEAQMQATIKAHLGDVEFAKF